FKGENIGVVERPTWYWSELTSYENMIDYDGFNQLLFFQDFTIYARYGAPQISNVVIKEGSVKQTYEVFEKISNSQVVAIIVVSYTLGKPSQEVEIRLNDISNFYFNIEGTREAKIDYFSHNLTFTYTVVDSRPKIVEANEFDISKNGEMFQLVLRNELVNSVMEYDFNGKITVESGATWKLYNNNNENKVEMVDKIAHFGVYDNAVTVYVEVTKGNKSMWYVAYLQKAGKTYLSFDSQTETSFEPVEVINGKPYTLPTNKPTKKGYIFDGWFVSGIRLDGLNWPYNTSAVAYAVWQIDSYTLTFDSAGGNSVPSIVVSYGGYYNLPIPTRVGHNFEGWFIDEICLDGQNWGFGENRTAVARWTANSYTLTFDSAGGDRVPSIVVSYGGNYTLPTTIKAGHTFEGWFIDETRIDGLNWSYGTNRDAVARWSRNSYTLTFDSAGGNSVPSIVVSYGGNYTLPTPTRAGYTFAGWFIDGTRVNGYNWFFEANKTAVARWTTNSYNLDFDSAGGNREPSISVSYGGNYNLPTPTRVGHTFVGWFIDETRIDGLNWLFETNKTAIARWTTNSYNLTVDSAGGNSIPSLVVSYGDYYNLPDPTRVGYTFEGWYKTNTNERFLGYCQWYIESDVSVTAKWTIATSRLSFNSDKGTTASPIIITYGQNYILPTSTKEGYIFDGWYVDTTKLDGLNWTY
ncbi:MAG: InlB B-repeat-containing protein, partial [Clostridia bacterium]